MSVTSGQTQPASLAVESTNSTANAGTRILHVAGVDVGRAQIRAGVFDAAGRLLGKSKRSTKQERGKNAVLARIVRCLEDAVDECDLAMSQIRAIGVSVPGPSGAPVTSLLAATTLGWENEVLFNELRARLDKPVFAERHHQLAALGIFFSELAGRPGTFAAVIIGRELGGGLLIAGQTPDDSRGQQFGELIERSQRALANEPESAVLSSLPNLKLRKGVRRSHPVAMAYALKAGHHAGQAIASIVKAFRPETVALGGGVVEEIKREIMPVVAQAASEVLGHDIEQEVQLVASILGDTASLAGGACFASQRLARAQASISI